MIRPARSSQALLLCAALVGARPAHADPSTQEIANARQAFESAAVLEAEQKWVEAAEKLRQALAVKDTPGLRFHLAHCEAEQGLLLEAAADYDRASELLREGAKAPDVQKLLIPASAELKRRIPHIKVDIPSDIVSPAAELDGKVVAPSELSHQALNPGAHQLKLSARGRSPFESSFSVKEGEELAIRADLPEARPALSDPALGPRALTPAPADAPSAERPIASPRRSSAKLYWLVGESVVTAAGLALGIGYAVAGASARDRVQGAQSRIDAAAPSNPGACSSPGTLSQACADLHTAIDDHDRDGTLSTVGFVVGGVGAAALVTTWLVYPHSTSDGARASVQPVVGLGALGVRGRF
jgi:hypothetical protein